MRAHALGAPSTARPLLSARCGAPRRGRAGGQRQAPAVVCRQQPPQRQAHEKVVPASAVTPASASRTLGGRHLDEPPAGAPAASPSAPAVDVDVAPNAEPATKGMWAELPGRYKLVFATSLSFVICNMDKVNISVAIIPMAQDFGWSPTVAGLVQSSFFWGYLLSQIPGGYASSIWGGRTVLPRGVALWSVATAGVPLLASTLPGLFVSRAAVGLGEGVAPSAATDIVARTIPTDQRSRAISFVFGGLHVGSLLGLLIAPVCIHNFGWPSVFYLFGGMGLLWAAWWESLVEEVRLTEPELVEQLTSANGVGSGQRQQQQQQLGQQQEQQGLLSNSSGNGTAALAASATAPVAAAAAAAAAAEQEAEAAAMAGHGGHGGVIDARAAVPWRAFLRNPALRALGYTHYCNNWFHYTMLAWLPTYFTDSLSLDLGRAAQVSLLPPIAAIAVSAIAGPSADALISRGVPVETVRKVAQCTAFLGPAACLLTASFLDSGPATVGLVTLSLGLASFSLAGLYSNHADLSPRYASILLGMTNTTGALPGIVGVAFTGWLYDQTGSWSTALFLPSIFFFLTGSAVYVAWGSADRQPFDEPEPDNSPFQFENWLRSLLPGGSGSEGGGSDSRGGEEGEGKSKRD